MRIQCGVGRNLQGRKQAKQIVYTAIVYIYRPGRRYGPQSAELPAFRSESEEADWYATPAGRRYTQREFERALRGGTLQRSTGAKLKRTDPKLLAQLMEQAKQRATKAVSLRIPVADLERARAIAEKKGVGYQSVMKEAIREGLKRVG